MGFPARRRTWSTLWLLGAAWCMACGGRVGVLPDDEGVSGSGGRPAGGSTAGGSTASGGRDGNAAGGTSTGGDAIGGDAGEGGATGGYPLGGSPGTGGTLPGPSDCVVGDELYLDATPVPSGDSCNRCICNDGAVSCTSVICADEEACDAPFDAGPCQAAMQVWWHNSNTGVCGPAVYGGCGGNDNRYDSFDACKAACGSVGDSAACEVDGVVYPDGSRRVPDPQSCNLCRCEDGLLTDCSDVECPRPCPEGTMYGEACAECGLGGGCRTTKIGCFTPCMPNQPCERPGEACFDGSCSAACL